mmetsp:Transcript_7018/g.12214  ORF Transcript_7018/g.12214 Transcript_7018/m.12214 type:complete len:85 (+) Transcript_7018:346-600(+)
MFVNFYQQVSSQKKQLGDDQKQNQQLTQIIERMEQTGNDSSQIIGSQIHTNKVPQFWQEGGYCSLKEIGTQVQLRQHIQHSGVD